MRFIDRATRLSSRDSTGRSSSRCIRSGIVKGRLEDSHEGYVHGWALCPSLPEERQRVTLIGEPAFRLTVTADRYRADLYRAGFGDGHYGFSVPLEAFPEVKSVRACLDGSGAALAGDPVLIEPGRPLAPQTLDGFRFRLDRPVKGALTGWVVDETDVTRRVQLTLRHRGQTLAQARATRFRSDIGSAGADMLHGFRLAWTAKLSGFGELMDGTRGTILAKVKLRA